MLFKMKAIIPIAIVISALSTFGIFKFLQKQKEKIQDLNSVYRKVVIARVDLPIGKKLMESFITIGDWPEKIIPKGSFSSIEDVIGRVIKTEMYEGEAIVETKLASKGSDGGFSSIIPLGLRALTVSVDTYSGVSGFLLPNTRVDVLVTVPSNSKKEESTTKIILEDIKVLAVDQTFEREDDDPVIVQSVTLLVTPEQAEKLALASMEGKLQLSLRNNADHALKSTAGVQLKELIGRTRPKRSIRRTTSLKQQPVAKETPNQTIVEVIRSNERTQVIFGEKEGEAKASKK